MQERTYDALPADVLASLPRDQVRLDASIPRDMVDVASQGRIIRMPVNAFIRARRKARKSERRNRRAGRR